MANQSPIRNALFCYIDFQFTLTYICQICLFVVLMNSLLLSLMTMMYLLCCVCFLLLSLTKNMEFSEQTPLNSDLNLFFFKSASLSKMQNEASLTAHALFFFFYRDKIIIKLDDR